MKKEIISEYFQSQLDKNNKVIKDNFDDKAVYSECYGPIYRNKKEILAQFSDWNEKGTVLVWTIKRIIIIHQTSIVEWHFKCDYLNKISEFDGVSLIDFNLEDKIICIKEFESKSDYYYPYSQN